MWYIIRNDKIFKGGNSTQAQKRNNLIDVLKCAACFAVILLHFSTHEFEQRGILLQTAIGRCAVPIFFMISGYFTYGVNLDSKIRKRIIYLLKIFGIGFLIYLLRHIARSGSLDFINIILCNIKTMILYNEVMFGGHFWYIPAYMYVIIIVWLVNKYRLSKYLYYAVPLLIIAGLVYGWDKALYSIIYQYVPLFSADRL